MRLSYSPCAHVFLFLIQWIDSHLVGALELIRILMYKVILIYFSNNYIMLLSMKFDEVLRIVAYDDGKTTVCLHEKKASIREFYGE